MRSRHRGKLRLNGGFGFAVESAPLSNELFDEWGGLPIIAESLAVLVDARQHRRQSDCVRVEHGTAAVPGKPETVGVDDVDVASALSEVLLEDARAFVGKCRRDPGENLFVGDSPSRDPTLIGLLG